MFSAREKRLLGQLVFEAWTSPTFATALLSDPQAVMEARGIRDHHGRKFQVTMDTVNTMHLIVPWLPDDMRKDPDSLSPADKASQVRGLLRVTWNKAESAQLFGMLRAVWTDSRVANKLLNDPRKTLEHYLSKRSLRKLGEHRIVALEDSAVVVNVVIGMPPPELMKQLEELQRSGAAHIMCSASFCLCDDDDENGDDENGNDQNGDDKKGDDKNSGAAANKSGGPKRAARKKEL